MKKTVMVILLLILLTATFVTSSDKLPREEQERIINNYLQVTGQLTAHEHASPATPAEGDQPPDKCGTPAVNEFLYNRDKFDDDLLISLGVEAVTRPVLPLSYPSPGGHFLIHYAVTGEDAVWQANIDNNPPNGIPDYIDTVAMVADSVWVHEIDDLGFAPPVIDTGCAEGGDARIDIYISNLPGNIFGLTWAEIDCAVEGSFLMNVPAYMELDNDYQHVFVYKDKPADAVRVTLAHEFFHIVQFGIDFTEIENPYWLEMASTWMEEYVYDDINDYYAYLPSFFNQPNTSLQQNPDLGLHAYGSVVYPIFLSEKYGDGIMKAIWDKSVELGVGGDFLRATDMVIDSASGGTEDWTTSFAEFSLWNFFTGSRAPLAPSGMAYSEGANYPIFDTLAIAVHDDYPVDLIPANENPYKPEHNGLSLIQFKNTTLVQEERLWRCDVDSAVAFSPFCKQEFTRHVSVTDPLEADVLDTSFSVAGILESMQGSENGQIVLAPWSISFVKQLEAFPDSLEVEQYFLPSVPCSEYNCFTTYFFTEIDRVNKYRSVTMLLSGASSIDTLYKERKGRDVAYSVPELNSGDTAIVIDSSYTVAAERLLIFPNPAVVVEMGGEPLRIRMANLQTHGLDITNNLTVNVRTVLNMFDVSGQKVFSEDVTVVRNLTDFLKLEGEPLEIPWDMNNQSGQPVSSGVYFCVVELFVDRVLIASGKGKVAIIR